MTARIARLVVLLLVAAVPAWAETPVSRPTRDVDVHYAMAAGLQQRMRWDVAKQLLRVDPPGNGPYMIIDYRNGRMSLVHPDQHVVIDVTGSAPLPTPDSGDGQWERGTTDTVAGLACTEWLTQDTTGRPVALCLTPDGVLLRARAATGVLVQADKVDYVAADPAAFQIPADYQVQHMDAAKP
jgi:hypothetical protein